VSTSQTILATLPATWTDRYLAMLGVERGTPSLEALTRLNRAHVESVLFGTVQSVLRKRAQPEGPVPPMDPAALLDAWERRAGSGVCFEVAGMVHLLLTELGYQSHVALATVSGFWPGGHQGVVVELDGRRYLVDVGNGAPFFSPIPLDGTTELRHVGLAYRFHPGDEPHIWVQDRWINGAWDPFCTYDLRPPLDAEIEAAYQRHHQPGESWVVSVLRLIRCGPAEVTVLNDATVTRFKDTGKSVETIEDPAEYRRIAADLFDAPDLPIDETRTALADIANR
jgi:arylamine N-acetyltransferase